MKAISMKQPYAWLMANGYKMPEFRSRQDQFRGECYIHSPKTVDKQAFMWIAKHLGLPFVKQYFVNGLPPADMFITGKVIGQLTVIDCITLDEAKRQYPNNIWVQSNNGELGTYAFITRSPIYFPPSAQFPLKGKVFPLFFNV